MATPLWSRDFPIFVHKDQTLSNASLNAAPHTGRPGVHDRAGGAVRRRSTCAAGRAHACLSGRSLQYATDQSARGGSGQQDPPTLKYKGRPVKTFQAKDSCRHLGFWATPNGDMAKTKQRVLAKTREVLGLLTHHPFNVPFNGGASENPKSPRNCFTAWQ
jgi:hypothetical protein